MFRIGVGAVITNERGEVLLCRRTDYDLWNLPGGGMEPGEAPWEAAVREAREEIGVEVEVTGLVGLYFKPDADELYAAFRCKIVGGELELTDEADAIEYFSADDLPENLSPRQVERIQDALVGTEVVFRTQVGPGARELIARGLIAPR